MFDLTVLGVVVVDGVVVVVVVVGVVAVSVVVVDGGFDDVLPEDVGVGVELTPPPPPHAASMTNGKMLAQARAWVSLIRIHTLRVQKTLERSMPERAKESLNAPETEAVKD